jgi:hypothetical protein
LPNTATSHRGGVFPAFETKSVGDFDGSSTSKHFESPLVQKMPKLGNIPPKRSKKPRFAASFA